MSLATTSGRSDAVHLGASQADRAEATAEEQVDLHPVRPGRDDNGGGAEQPRRHAWLMQRPGLHGNVCRRDRAVCRQRRGAVARGLRVQVAERPGGQVGLELDLGIDGIPDVPGAARGAVLDARLYSGGGGRGGDLELRPLAGPHVRPGHLARHDRDVGIDVADHVRWKGARAAARIRAGEGAARAFLDRPAGDHDARLKAVRGRVSSRDVCRHRVREHLAHA